MLRLTPLGCREMIVGTLLLALIAFGLHFIHPLLALLPLPVFIWLLAFFRDPNRSIPSGPNLLVSPADGVVSDITEFELDPVLNVPTVRVGIFLSVFNVHINRAPCDARIVDIRYKTGKFLNAMHHSAASDQNESNTLILALPNSDAPTLIVKQIVGLIARRIICTVKIAEPLTRGQRIGMIKFGSRTELTIAKSLAPQIEVKVGQPVRGAADIIARYTPPLAATP